MGERRAVAGELGGPLTEAFTGAIGSQPPGPVQPSLSSPSTALPPLPSHLPLPVQPTGVGVWLSPGKRIISSVMYIQTHARAASWEDKARRGSPRSWPEGVYNQVIEPEPEPSRNGAVNGSRGPGPSEINRCCTTQAAAWPRPLLSPQLPPGPACLSPSPFHLGCKCRSESNHWATRFQMSGCGSVRGCCRQVGLRNRA